MNSLVGSTQTTVRPGETAQASIQLQGGPVIAKAFVIHFARDSAFIEPPMRPVLRQVAEYAAAHPKEKLLIVGHTDLTGSSEYNQSLSERRARSVYAFLTYGNDRAAAISEWSHLRLKRPKGEQPSKSDTWGICEYQQILQDLGYYMGNINGMHDSLTYSAVAEFQKNKHLYVDGIVGDITWNALLGAYLLQDNLTITSSSLFSKNAQVLKWLGCGELDPVENRQDAWRPNRRTELLFVPAVTFPFDIAKPDTFDEDDWRFGVQDSENRCGFATRDTPVRDKWLIQAVQPGLMRVQGSIKFQNGAPLSNAKFEIVAPNGEILDGEHSVAGTAVLGRTDGDGLFSYTKTYPGWGVYTMALQGPYVVSLSAASGKSDVLARGSTAWRNFKGMALRVGELQGVQWLSLDETQRTLDLIAYMCPSQVEIAFQGYETNSSMPLSHIIIGGISIDLLSKPLRLSDVEAFKKSLFIIEAYTTEWSYDLLEIQLLSLPPCSESEAPQHVDVLSLMLTRDSSTPRYNRYISQPLLAISPYLVKRHKKYCAGCIDEYIVVGALAGGSFIAYAPFIHDPTCHPMAAEYTVKAAVKGAVVYVYPQVITCNNTSVTNIVKEELLLANKVWAQAGIEVKQRTPGNLLCGEEYRDLHAVMLLEQQCKSDILYYPDYLGGYTGQGKRLFGLVDECYLGADTNRCAPRSSIVTDVNVYFVDDIFDDLGATLGLTVIITDPPVPPVVVMELVDNSRTLAHELGHLFLRRHWAKFQEKYQSKRIDDHYDLRGKPWPPKNILSEFKADGGSWHLNETQIIVIRLVITLEDIMKTAGMASNYCVVFE